MHHQHHRRQDDDRRDSHEHEHDRDLLGDGAGDWDRRYGAVDRHWSGAPNGALVAEVADLVPGTALDIGCGEGADAIWLAEHGWRVSATDISSVAIERAREAAARAGVDVAWRQGDIGTDGAGPARHDLVSVHYPAFRHTDDDRVIHAIVGSVAPGGTLLVVGHSLDALAPEERPNAWDPADYVQPGDIARHLDDTWTVEVHEVRPRVQPPGHRGPDMPDVVLRARAPR